MIDNRIVSMQFNNSGFDEKVSKTKQNLDSLNESLAFNNADKGANKMTGAFANISSAIKKVTFDPIANGLDQVSSKFTAFEAVVFGIFERLGAQAADFAVNFVKSLSLDQVTAGFSEYELKMDSLKTMIANDTTHSLDEINAMLDGLNEYADKTIYTFSDMTTAIGRFVAMGVDIESAVDAIQGASNLTALTGGGNSENQRVMYNTSQALATGYMSLMDWKSMENARVSNQWYEQIMEVMKAMDAAGKLSEGQSEFYKESAKNYGYFRENLKDGYVTSEIIVESLKAFSDTTTELGQKAMKAATEVTTFSKLIDTLKESVGSGWAQTFEILLGDYSEAKTLWTYLNDTLGDMINKVGELRNSILSAWSEGGGYAAFVESIKNIIAAFQSIIAPVKEAWTAVFAPYGTQDFINKLITISNKIKEFTANLKLTEEQADRVRIVFSSVFSSIKMVVKIIAAVVTAIGKALWPVVKTVGNIILSLIEKIADALFSVVSTISAFLSKVFGIKDVAQEIPKVVSSVKEATDEATASAEKATTAVEEVADATETLTDSEEETASAADNATEAINNTTTALTETAEAVKEVEKSNRKGLTSWQKFSDAFGTDSWQKFGFGSTSKTDDTSETTKAASTTARAATSASETIAKAATTASSAVASATSDSADSVEEAVSEASASMSSAKDATSSVIDKITEATEKTSLYRDKVEEVSDKYKSMSEFVDKFGESVDKVFAKVRGYATEKILEGLGYDFKGIDFDEMSIEQQMNLILTGAQTTAKKLSEKFATFAYGLVGISADGLDFSDMTIFETLEAGGIAVADRLGNELTDFTKKFHRAGDSISAEGMTTSEKIRSMFLLIFDEIGYRIKSVVTTIKTAFKTAFDDATKTSVLNGIQKIFQSIGVILKTIYTLVSNITNKIDRDKGIEKFSDVVHSTASAFEIISQKVYDIVVNMSRLVTGSGELTGIWAKARTYIDKIKSKLPSLNSIIDKVSGTLKDAFDTSFKNDMLSGLLSSFETIKIWAETIKMLIQEIMEEFGVTDGAQAFSDTVHKSAEYFAIIANKIRDLSIKLQRVLTGTGELEGGWKELQTVVGYIKKGLFGIIKAIKAIINPSETLVKTFSIDDKIFETAKKGLDNIATTLFEISDYDTMSNMLSDLGSVLNATTLTEKVVNTIKMGVKVVWDYVKAIPDKINKIKDTASSLGDNFLTGFATSMMKVTGEYEDLKEENGLVTKDVISGMSTWQKAGASLKGIFSGNFTDVGKNVKLLFSDSDKFVTNMMKYSGEYDELDTKLDSMANSMITMMSTSDKIYEIIRGILALGIEKIWDFEGLVNFDDYFDFSDQSIMDELSTMLGMVFSDSFKDTFMNKEVVKDAIKLGKSVLDAAVWSIDSILNAILDKVLKKVFDVLGIENFEELFDLDNMSIFDKLAEIIRYTCSDAFLDSFKATELGSGLSNLGDAIFNAIIFAIKHAWGTFVDIIKQTKVGEAIYNTISKSLNGLVDWSKKNKSLFSWNNIIKVAALSKIFDNVLDAWASFKRKLAFADAIKSFSNYLDILGGSLKKFTGQVKALALIGVAAGLLVIAEAINELSKVDSNSAEKNSKTLTNTISSVVDSVGTLGKTAGVGGVASNIISSGGKLSKVLSYTGFGASVLGPVLLLVGMAEAIKIITKALKNIDDVDPKKLESSMDVVTRLIKIVGRWAIIMTLMFGVASMLGNMFSEEDNSKKATINLINTTNNNRTVMDGIADALKSIAALIGVMVVGFVAIFAVLKKVDSMENGEEIINKTLGLFAALLTVAALAMAGIIAAGVILSKNNVKSDTMKSLAATMGTTAAILLSLGISLGIMLHGIAKIIKNIGKYNVSQAQLNSVTGIIAIAMLGIVAMLFMIYEMTTSATTKTITKKEKFETTLSQVAKILTALGKALRQVFVGMAIFLGVVAVCDDSSTVSMGLNTIIGILLILIAGIAAIMYVASNTTVESSKAIEQTFSGIKGMLTGLALMIAALAVFMFAIKKVELEKVSTAMGLLMGVLLALTALVAVILKLTPNSKMAKATVAVIASLAILIASCAASLYIAAKAGNEPGFLEGVAALFGIMLEMMLLLALLNKMGKNADEALKYSVAVIALAAAVAIIAGSLYTAALAAQQEGFLEGVLTLAGIMGAFLVVAALLTKFGGDSAGNTMMKIGASCLIFATGCAVLAASLFIAVEALKQLTEFFTNDYEQIKQALDNAIALMPQIGEFILTFLTTLVRTILQTLVMFAVEIADAILVLVTSIIEKIAEYAPRIMEALKALAPYIKQILMWLINTLFDILETTSGRIIELLTSILQQIRTDVLPELDLLIQDVITLLSNGVQKLFDEVSACIIKFVSDLTITWLVIKPMLEDLWDSVIDFLLGLVDTLLAEVNEHLNEWITAIIDIIVDIIEGIENGVEKITNALSSLMLTVCDAILKMFETGGEALGKLAQIPSKIIAGIKSAFTDKKVEEDTEGIGGGLISTMFDGIKSKISEARESATGIAKVVLDTLANVLGIASPSKETEQMGEYLVEGMSKGLDKKSKEGAKSAAKFSGLLLDSMKNSLDNEAVVNDFNGIKDSIMDILNTDTDMSFTITPVFDSSEIESGIKNMTSMFDSSSIGMSANLFSDMKKSTNQNGTDLEALLGSSSGTTINYTQNNYSPKSLSRDEIYRRTRNQLNFSKGVAY